MLTAKCEQTGLHPEIESFAREQGWDGLRPFQKEAADLILQSNCDLIISASTAAGKTEAAFFPLITQAVGRTQGVSVLCLSPTKALINDQVRRIQAVAERVGVPVYAWHGDAPESRKRKLLKEGLGIVIMTIESLEGRLVRQPRMIEDLFAKLDAVVIDEFHEFLGGARGAQLGCLLARLDNLALAPPRRIALSATISDTAVAKRWIRPQEPGAVKLVKGSGERMALRSRVRGYAGRGEVTSPSVRSKINHRPPMAIREIEGSIFERLRGGTRIVFAGARSTVEDLCSGLSARCERARAQNSFVPHHGSMAKKARESVEERLRLGEELTVLSTTTLALGVDIGSIDSVELIGAPLSLTTFRQMVGRSGRRDAPAVVDLHITEHPLQSAIKIGDRLRLSTVRACAALNLLEQRYFEPSTDDGTTLSVVVQQLLSIIKQRGGANVPYLLNIMQSVAAFDFVTERRLREMVEHLATPGQGFLEPTVAGCYILTEKGEKLVHALEFYAAFQVSDQWDVVEHDSGKVGQISLGNPLVLGDKIRLAGTAWEVKHVDLRHYRVVVVPASTGSVPTFDYNLFAGVDGQLAQEMQVVLSAPVIPADLDRVASQHLCEGRAAYQAFQLQDQCLVADGEICHLFSWNGTRFNMLLAAVLRYSGFVCSFNEVAVTIAHGGLNDVAAALSGDFPSIEQLAERVGASANGKHDRKIPVHVLTQYWAHRHAALLKTVRAFCESRSLDGRLISRPHQAKAA